jgi:ATP-dependent DNA helicase RecQ
MVESEIQIAAHLSLTPETFARLPAELYECLLTYLQRWGSPSEQIKAAEQLLAVNGVRLPLLDYLAQAYLAAGQPEKALTVIERRQRRNATFVSQSLEAKALLLVGRRDAARQTAQELVRTHPTNSAAILAAAKVLLESGDGELALSLVETYRQRKPYDLAALLMGAEIALALGQRDLADAQLQRLGGGVPVDVEVEHLVQMERLATALGKLETANAVRLELQRRRQQDLIALQERLAPFLQGADLLTRDPESFYEHYTGLDAVQLTPEERRRVELEALRHFGFERLRKGQAEAIALALLRNRSVLMVMPTGGGKSLCYQLPALVSPHVTLVISPLIALMKDQVEGLPHAARPLAVFINSTLSDAEVAERMERIVQGKYKLVYAAPERLRQRAFLHVLRRAGVDLFVIDEAHCVSMWGHDFRPDYLFIREARRALGAPRALAMTATAPPRIRDEIIEMIGDGEEDSHAGAHATRPHVIALDIFRPNLHLCALQFQNEEEKLAALVSYVRNAEGSGIVYVNSRSRAEAIALALQRAGVRAEAYHAGLVERGPVQDRFMRNQTRVVVATIAFGMGIDKPDIRFIVHFHPSRSLDAYYQEVGRAGRDGQLSQGILFYSNNDWANLRRWARAEQYTVDFLHRVYAAVAAQLQGQASLDDRSEEAGRNADATSPSNAQTLSGAVDLRRLQQVLDSDETTLRVAVSMLERAGLLRRGFDLPREVTISVPRHFNRKALEERPIARLFKGLQLGPEQSATFALSDIARFMRWRLEETEVRLLEWQDRGLFALRFARRAMHIEMPPEPEDLYQRLDALLAQSEAVALRRIDDMIGYATTESCRHGYISAYFGSPPRMRCSVCDNCTGVRPAIELPERLEHLVPDDVDIEPMIIDCLMSLPKPVGRSGLARILAGSLRAPFKPDQARHHGALKALGEAAALAYIDDLIEQNRLRQYSRQDYLVLAPTLRGRIEAEAWLAEHPELARYGEASLTAEEPEPTPTEDADHYTALQKALWSWRRRLAEQLGQPPYVVMRNELMLQIAETRPQTLEELAALPGMGAQRLQHYGETILDIIKLHPPQPGDEEKLAAQREARRNDVAARAVVAPDRSSGVVAAQMQKQIYMRLQELRQKLAVKKGVKPYMIASNALLKTIAQRAPATLAELDAILGFRTSALAPEAVQILTMIQAVRTHLQSKE